MADPYGPPGPARPPRRSTATIVVAVALALVVGITSVGIAGLAAWALFIDRGDDPGTSTAPPPEPSATSEPPAYPPELTRFYEQDLEWRDCGANECTWLRVPLDYASAGQDTLRLAVLRVPAGDRGRRVGQLVVNPGGPGASGVDYAAGGRQVFGAQVARYYDIVGFDPRGVGRSATLECASTEETDAYLAADPDPDNPREVADLARLTRELGQGCLSRSGELTRRMSTVEVARDMDILRAALGEAQLDFLGASYGTFIGATYADLFPANVRRMVLDGAVDPSLSTEELALGQARGFQRALEAYVADCVSQADCVLGDSVAEGTRRLRSLLDEIDAEPLATGDERELTEGLAVTGVIFPLYLKELWPVLTKALTQAIEQGRGDALLVLSDQYTRRGEDSYTSNLMVALPAVNCLDHGDFVPTTQVPSRFAQFEKASPTFGRGFAYGLSSCQWWPVRSDKEGEALDAAGAPPIVVIGTTRDPATPYEWAEGLAAQLDSGVLVSRDGDGHTGFQQGNRCVDRAVEVYLLAGTPPEDGLSC